ncbi:hypothetical protein C8R44DRAFT_976254 [Mycena epipterygia]|nr:hypothetical protein C8R44DRAFT_976254 [Mycena epipterygia]
MAAMLSFRRSFSVSPAALASGHPYTVDPSAPACAIPFLELRGIGPPAWNFGSAGDVYLDLSAGLHALYWRDHSPHNATASAWRRWTALILDKVPLHDFLISHPWAKSPMTSDLYLWMDPYGITWTSQDNIRSSRVSMVQRNIGRPTPGSPVEIEALVSHVLRTMLETESQLSFTGPPGNPRLPRPAQPRSPPPAPRASTIYSQRSQTPGPFNVAANTLPRIQSLTRHATAAAHSSFPPGNPRLPFNAAANTLPRIQSFTPHATPPPHSMQPHRQLGQPSRTVDPSHSGRSSDDPSDTWQSTSSSPVSHGTAQDRASDTWQSTSSSPISHGTTQDRASLATEKMTRALQSEELWKQKLRAKTRELAKFKHEEKELIAMSYRHDKRVRELTAKIAAAELKSAEEMSAAQEALLAVRRQADAVQTELRISVARLRCSEDELAAAERQRENLHAYVELLESENGRLKELGRMT